MSEHVSGNHVGERRKPVHFVHLSVPVSICIEWPEGIPVDIQKCKEIAACSVAQRWETDVSPVSGKIVWAQCGADCSESDVELVEDYEI